MARLSLLVLTVALVAVPSAQARTIVTYAVCEHAPAPKQCDRIVIGAYMNKAEVRPGDKVKVCLLTNCRPTKVFSLSIDFMVRVSFSGVGPYRCGSPVAVSMRYFDRETRRSHVERVRPKLKNPDRKKVC